MDYDFDHLISYVCYVREEMTRRGYRTMNSVWDKIVSLKKNWMLLPLNEIYPDKMEDLYLTICYYNLYEKYLCNGIDKKVWNEIIGTASDEHFYSII